MEPADRLAAFLADELSADERRALEAELARDAHLRAQLEAMRRADVALTGVAPTALPDGARDRLLAALEPTLDAELGPAAPPATADELAARRRSGSRRSWLTAAGGVAAAVAAVAILGPIVGGFGGGDDTALSAGDGDAETAETSSVDDGGEAADDAAAGAFAPVGPTLLGSGRSLDEEAATELLAAGEVEAVVAQGLSAEEAQSLGAAWADAFGADASELETFSTPDSRGGQEEAPAAPEEHAEVESEDATLSDQSAADEARLAADLQILGDVDESAREDVARCLETLLDAGGVVVPALAELVTFGGEPAIAYALVGVAPDGTVSRPEIWVLARDSCETRYLRQG